MKHTSLLWLPFIAPVLACGGLVPLNGDADAGTHLADGEAPHPDAATDAGPYALPAATMSSATVGGSGALTIAQTGTVYRFYPDGTTPDQLRPADAYPSWVDAQDCDDDIILQFTLSEGGLPTTDIVQVWAGTTDCSQATARMAGPGPHCWQVAPAGAFADSLTVTGNVYVRNLVRGLADPDAPFDGSPVTGVPGAAACGALGTTAQCPSSLEVYFLFVNNDGVTADAYFAFPQGVFLAPTDAGTCVASGG